MCRSSSSSSYSSPRFPFFITMMIFHFLAISHTTSLSFNFTTFEPSNRDIRYEGDAHLLDSVIQLTGNQIELAGHATYLEPLHLWDKASGKLANFTTRFSFSIDSQSKTAKADGIAFFLAPLHFQIPDKEQGSGLGLASDDLALNSTSNPFVAVEFDTYCMDSWDDLDDDHVGIDINSLRSSNSVRWHSSVRDGRITDARIDFNSSTKFLCVFFTGIAESKLVQQEICHEIDLRDYLPEWVTVGFSAATGQYYSEFHRIHSWSFSSNLQTIENTTNFIPPPFANSSPDSRKKYKTNVGLLIMSLTIPLTGSAVLVLFYFCFRKSSVKRRGNQEDYPSITHMLDMEFESGFRKFSYNEIALATNNFAGHAKLGEGGIGPVYKGFLHDSHTYVAVKKLSRTRDGSLKEWENSVKTLSRLRHRNLVQLIGWCPEGTALLLVYEYMPNRSLDVHLFNEERMLRWEQRYQIALGLAAALLYLHEGCEKCILHRDIKPSNVMLDSYFNAKLGDFGMSHLFHPECQKSFGTIGYMAPECFSRGKLSRKSDVYSFGVVALQIACGRNSVVERDDGTRMPIVQWIYEFYQTGILLEAADPKLSGDFDKEQMERLLIVGLWCARAEEALRPSIIQVLHVLNFETPLPDLPQNHPYHKDLELVKI